MFPVDAFCLSLWTTRGRQKLSYTQRNLFEILSNQTEIRFYIPFFDLFRTANTLIPNQLENG